MGTRPPGQWKYGSSGTAGFPDQRALSVSACQVGMGARREVELWPCQAGNMAEPLVLPPLPVALVPVVAPCSRRPGYHKAPSQVLLLG
jgi:hypothetical protein